MSNLDGRYKHVDFILRRHFSSAPKAIEIVTVAAPCTCRHCKELWAFAGTRAGLVEDYLGDIDDCLLAECCGLAVQYALWEKGW